MADETDMNEPRRAPDGTGENAADPGIARQRAKRIGAGANVCVSVLLAAALTAILNYLVYRYGGVRLDVSRRNFYTLSDRTVELIDSLKQRVAITAFIRLQHELFADIRNLLREYEYEGARSHGAGLTVEILDPDRDLAKVKRLGQEYGIEIADVIVFECAGRRRIVRAGSASETEYDIDREKLLLNRKMEVRSRPGFAGERLISSAIRSVAHPEVPVVYFLAGHGERDIGDSERKGGYSSLAYFLRRENIDVRKITLGRGGVPSDCDALIVAGPDRRISRIETDFIERYLHQGGRVFFLLDPATVTGLDPLLRNWGVKIERDVVVDPARTRTGHDILVTRYGYHDITRNLRNVAPTFYMPRSVEPESAVPGPEPAADRLRVQVLAVTTPDGWAERDLAQNPSRYDKDTDRRGPISLAVAVEKGGKGGSDLELKPTRIVVIGDSYMVSNAVFSGGGGGGNSDLFLAALNWLLERETLMPIPARTPARYRLNMTRSRIRLAYLMIVGGMPAVMIVIAVAVGARRRR